MRPIALLLLLIALPAPVLAAPEPAADEQAQQPLRAAFIRGDYAGFIPLARQWLAVLAARGASGSVDAADMHYTIGMAQIRTNDSKGAAASARAALAILRRRADAPPALVINAHRVLALALEMAGARADASRIHARIIRLYRAGGGTGPETAWGAMARLREAPLAVSAAERSAITAQGEAIAADLTARRWPAAEAGARALLTRLQAINPAHSETATAHYLLALALNGSGAEAPAETQFRLALALMDDAAGAESPGSMTLVRTLAVSLINARREDEALPLLRRLLEARRRQHGENHAQTRDATELLAQAHEAIGQWRAAEPLRRQLAAQAEAGGRAQEADLAGQWHALARNLARQGRLGEAEGNYRRALLIRETRLGSDRAETLETQYQLAGVLLARSDRLGALSYASHVLKTRERRFGPVAEPTAMAATRLADVMIAFGEAKAAEPVLRAMLSATRGKADFLPVVRAALETSLARVLEHDKRAAAAEPSRRATLAVMAARGALAHGEALGALAANLEQQGKPAKALALLNQARRLLAARLGADHPDVARLDQAIARCLLALTPAAAAAPARRALTVLRAQAERETLGEDEERLAQFAGSSEEAALLLARAAFADGNGERQRALALDALQSASSSAAGRALARGAARAAVPAAAQPLLTGWEAATEQRRRLDLAVGRGIDANGPQADARRQQLARERVAADRAVAAARAALAAAAPAYFRLVAPGPVALAALQRGQKGQPALLKANEALILLHPGSASLPAGQQNGLVIAVTREGTAWAQIPIGPAVLAREIAALRCELDHGGGADNSGCIARTVKGLRGGGAAAVAADERESFDRARAHRLYQALLGAPAIQRLIAGKAEWIMAPSGSLLSLPFAALVTAPPAGDDADPQALRATAWLGLQRPVSVVPEVSALAALRGAGRAARAASTPFFGVGDPAFGGTGGGGLRGVYRDATGDPAAIAALEPLPGTRAEVETQGRRLAAAPGAMLLGGEATEARLYERRDVLAGARVVMFATHGLLAGDLGGRLAQPALALSPPAPGAAVDPANDGLLTAAEAAGLSLSADWVILSACNTAAGDGGAEGLSGLARAFFHAGAGSLLVSHWRIRDDAAGRITAEAVARAGPGTSRAAALMQAMRALAADTAQDGAAQPLSHPSAWAPFALVGVTP